ncbi:hypothetical protein NC652_038723 [Populus alba x Populus x berolinensis]|nr:hypothetical protein NC652_038723 [Populus alba x Populus x berolinensis]
MADVLRNSVYGIMSAFHEKMLMTTKTCLLDKDWVTKSIPPFWNLETACIKTASFIRFTS